MDRSKKIISDTVIFTGRSYLANIFNVITGFVVRRILSPFLMGILTELMLIFEYTKNSQLGVLNALDREIPILNGRKQFKEAEEVKNIGFTVCLACSFLVAIVLFIVSFFINGGASHGLRLGIRIVSILAISQLGISTYIVVVRTHKKFHILSRYYILIAILDMIIKIAAVFLFGLYGFLWAIVFSQLMGLLYFYYASGYHLKIVKNFPLRKALRLLKIGFPLFLAGFIALTTRSIDRFMIILFLGTTQLGYYSIAVMFVGYIRQIPNLVYNVIFPNFYEAFGQAKNIQELRRFVIVPTMIFAYLFPVFIGVIILALPFLIYYILPRYEEGIIPAKILMMGSAFLPLTNMSGYLLIALDKQGRKLFIGVATIILSIILNYIFAVKFKWGLQGIALGTAVTYFVSTFIIISYAFIHFTKRIQEHIFLFIKLYLPFCWVICILLAIGYFFPKPSFNFILDLKFFIIQFVIFISACTPLIYYINKKTQILAKLVDVGLSKFKKAR